MKTFGKGDRNDRARFRRRYRCQVAMTRLPLEQQPLLSSLRDRVIREIDPSVAATVAPLVLRRQIEEIIHGIANKERLELSGREQGRLADDLPAT